MSAPTQSGPTPGPTSHAPRRFDAVVCDIDGCLGPESHEPLDAHALAALADYNRAAHERRDRPVITLCSGRPQPFVEALSRLLGNTSVPCVCENGVWVYDPRDNGFHRDPAITADHLHAVRDAQEWIEREWVPRGAVIQPGKAASISVWHADTAMLKGAITDSIRERSARHGWPLRVSATVAWINCDLAHVHKGTGIDRVVALTGLSRERLAGVGDSPSDRFIAQRVAFFAAPSNVHPDLRDACHLVAPEAEIAGVMTILRGMISGSSSGGQSSAGGRA